MRLKMQMYPGALLALILLLFQLYLLSFGKVTFGYHGSPVFILLSGLAIGILPFQKNMRFANTTGTAQSTWMWALPVVGAVACGLIVNWIIQTHPLDPKISDIIPSIQRMYIDRLMAGEMIYQPYYGFGYEFQPTYLPLFWLPYTVSEFLRLDHRWLAYAMLAASLFTWQWRLSKREMPQLEYLAKSILPWIIIAIFILSNKDTVAYTLECMVAGYYVWFVLSVLDSSKVKNAAGMVITLLSRYSNLLFLPLYALMGIRKNGWRAFAGISTMVIGAIILIYVVPFLSGNWSAFTDGYDYYSSATLYEWVRPDLGRPGHLYNGVGMAFWYYTFAPGDLAGKIDLLRYSQIVLTLVVPLILGAWYFLKKPDLHWRLFLLCSFQVYMALFYSFVQIPYAYLFIVPLMVGTLVVGELKWMREAAE